MDEERRSFARRTGHLRRASFTGDDQRKELVAAIRLVLVALGAMLRDLREHRGLSQAELASELYEFGFPTDQGAISRIERGVTPLVAGLELEVWLKRTGHSLTEKKASAIVEFRDLAGWFLEVAQVVPRGISAEDYRRMAVTVADMSMREPGDIRATRDFLQREIEELLESRGASELGEFSSRWRDSEPRHFADLHGVWKGKVDLSFEDIRGTEIRLRDEL